MSKHRVRTYENESKLNKMQLIIFGLIVMITGAVLDSLALYQNYRERLAIRELVESLNYDPNDEHSGQDDIYSIPTVQHTVTHDAYPLKDQIEIPDLFKYNNIPTLNEPNIDYLYGTKHKHTDDDLEETVDALINDLYYKYYDNSDNFQQCVDGTGDCAYDHVSEQVEQLLHQYDLNDLMSKFRDRVKEIGDTLDELQQEIMEETGMTEQEMMEYHKGIGMDKIEEEFNIHPNLL